MRLYSEVFTYTDQPTTCPTCGSRTEIIFDLYKSIHQTQIHQCLNCKQEFVVQLDIN